MDGATMNIPTPGRLWYLLRTRWREGRSLRRLAAAGLARGDIAIDCGANVGEITARMRAAGAEVYAFEPNPQAYAALQQRFAGDPGVHCLQKAVDDQPGTVKLFMHQRAAENPLMWSVGSSLVGTKSNVSADSFVEVEAVDLAAFIAALPQPVKVLKIDVEGVECRLLKRLFQTEAISRVEHVFVETHETRMPEMRGELDWVRAEIERRGLGRKVDLDWV
jgi:FkbM family methyltransferase